MSATLIDTSAWVGFFRGDGDCVRRVDPLLADGDAATCGAVYAEVLSGAPTRPRYERLARLFGALSRLESGPKLWERLADLRFLLARQGVQAHLVDLSIALTAADRGVVLLTRDRDFEHIARVLPVTLEVF